MMSLVFKFSCIKTKPTGSSTAHPRKYGVASWMHAAASFLQRMPPYGPDDGLSLFKLLP